MQLIPGATAPTMSSREVAELVEKRHDNVRRTIETLAQQGIIGLPQSEEVPSDGPGPKTITVYRVGKRDSYIIVAQLSPEFTARLVDRWQALEAKAATPALPNFTDPVAAARAWADAKEGEQKALELAQQQATELAAAAPAVAFVNRYVDANGSKGFREVCKLLRVNEREFGIWLIDREIMYRLGGKLTPRQKHIDAGRFEIKAGVNTANDHAFNQTRFTTKGVTWIAGEWGKRLVAA